MKHISPWLSIAFFLVLTFLGGFVGTVFGLWASSTRDIYRDEFLEPYSVRVDTAVVSNPTRQEKPDHYLVTLCGRSNATAADSQFYSVVRVIRHGTAVDVGEDSVTLRPAVNADELVGSVRVFRWLGDSLRIVTRNPMSESVTNASLSIISERSQ